MNGDPRYVEYLSFDTYGSNLLIHVTRPTPSTLAIESSFRIGCGDDSVLVLFASDESRWKELLVWQALPYKEISGAFGDFFVYSILPANPTHGLRVLAAHGRPWCTSRFSGFEMDLLAPQPTGGKPRVVWHTARGYSRGDAPHPPQSYIRRLRAAPQRHILRHQHLRSPGHLPLPTDRRPPQARRTHRDEWSRGSSKSGWRCPGRKPSIRSPQTPRLP